MNGWIKLHRQMLEWEWYTDNKTKALFLHLLLTANIVPQKRVLGYTLRAGQLVTTLPRLAAETGLTSQELRTAFKHLEQSGEVTQIVTNKFRLITIEKWAFYQADTSDLTDKQQTNNSQTTALKKESKEYNNIHYMSEAKKKPKKKNGFCNYQPSYDDDQIAEIERLEREQRILDL